MMQIDDTKEKSMPFHKFMERNYLERMMRILDLDALLTSEEKEQKISSMSKEELVNKLNYTCCMMKDILERLKKQPWNIKTLCPNPIRTECIVTLNLDNKEIETLSLHNSSSSSSSLSLSPSLFVLPKPKKVSSIKQQQEKNEKQKEEKYEEKQEEFNNNNNIDTDFVPSSPSSIPNVPTTTEPKTVNQEIPLFDMTTIHSLIEQEKASSKLKICEQCINLKNQERKKQITAIKKDYYFWYYKFSEENIIALLGSPDLHPQEYFAGHIPRYTTEHLDFLSRDFIANMNLEITVEKISKKPIHFVTNHRKILIRQNIIRLYVLYQNHLDMCLATNECFPEVRAKCAHRIKDGGFTTGVTSYLNKALSLYKLKGRHAAPLDPPAHD